MENQKTNSLLKDPRTNWSYILIVAVVAALAGIGILSYYSSFVSSIEA